MFIIFLLYIIVLAENVSFGCHWG